MCNSGEWTKRWGQRVRGRHASKVTRSNSNPTCCLATYAHLPTQTGALETDFWWTRKSCFALPYLIKSPVFSYLSSDQLTVRSAFGKKKKITHRCTMEISVSRKTVVQPNSRITNITIITTSAVLKPGFFIQRTEVHSVFQSYFYPTTKC